MRSCLVGLTFALAATTGWAVPPSSPVTISYSISRSGFDLAEVTDTISFDAHRFDIKSSGRGAGLLALIPKAQIARSSEGEIDASGLRPVHYREQRGNTQERTLAADFDWQSRRLTLNDSGGTQQQVDLPTGSLDRLSFPYSFSFLPQPPERWRLSVADGRHLTAYEFKLVGREKIATPLGTLPALHYTRLREGDDPVFDLWLGLDQHLLPLRIVFTDKDGGRFEQVVTRIDFHRS
jgi:hypothetical protein